MLIRIFEYLRKHIRLGYHTLTATPNKGNAAPPSQLSQAAQNAQDELARRNAMWHALRAALRGDKEAQYQIGISYLYGQLGLDRSYSHAERWLNQAAEQGHTTAKQALQDAYDSLAFS